MIIKTAEFCGSFTELKKCPQSTLPEYAFIGRSNVGKSSLINMLVNRKGLAKTSSTPGKTQTMNFFMINQDWYLVDLPGIGYAKTSKKLKAGWQQMIENYLTKRNSLMAVFYLVDIRLKPQKIDLEFMTYMGYEGIPFVIAFTKADKLGSQKQQAAVEAYKAKLLEEWEELPDVILTSAEKTTGKEEIHSFIASNNKAYADFIQTGSSGQKAPQQ